MESTTAPPWEDGDWELCNDDGFVYKRRKRRYLDQPPSSPPAQTGPDPEADELSRRDRKRKALSKLKARYQTEIAQWEYLSNILRAMEETTRHLRLQPSRAATSEVSPPVEVPPGIESAFGSLLDDLLLQVEAQEAIIRDASNLCDIAEAMCNTHEEEANQSLIDLPIWASPASPRELLASLSNR